MQKRHFKSQEPRSHFCNFLDNYLQQTTKRTYYLSSSKPNSLRFVPVEQVNICDNSENFLVQAERTLKEIQRDAMICLSRAAQFFLNAHSQKNQMFQLVECLKRLDLNIRSALEIGYIQCREYLKLRILQLDKSSPYLPVLKNVNACVRRLEEFSKAYILYLDNFRESSRADKKKCFSDLADEFIQEKSMDIESHRIKQIKKEVNEILFSRLIRNYLCEVNIESTEICRLCQQEIDVEILFQHVTLCKSKFEAKQQLQENTFHMKMLIDTIRKKQTTIIAMEKKSKRTSICFRVDSSCESVVSTSEHITKTHIKLLRKMEKVLEGQLTRKLISGYGKDFVLMVQIQKMNNFVRGHKQFLQLLNSFNKLLVQRQKIKDKLKKIQMNRLKQEEGIFLSAKSLNSDMMDTICPTNLSKKNINSSIKVLPDAQQLTTVKRKVQRLRRNYTFVQSWPSDEGISDRSLKFYSDKILFESSLFSQQDIQVKTIVDLKDFIILKFLGKGAFGKVYLVKRKSTEDLYAMKMVKIENSCSHLQDIVNELDILQKISGDYLVKASFSFTMGCIHFFFLDYMEGGDLSSLLQQEVYLQEAEAKVYIADIILALQHLHSLGIIHRDLKPQNLVFDREARLKLTDFGLSKSSISKILENAPSQKNKFEDQQNVIINRKKNLLQQDNCSRNKGYIIGTPDYIPPEMLLESKSSCSFTIDWWSLGVLIYEILIGERPFGAQTKEAVFDNILNKKIEWPKVGYGEGMITPESRDLIQRLLEMDPARRLGAQGANQIKNHQFFLGFDWENVKNIKKPFPTKSSANLLFLEEDLVLRKEIEEEIKKNQIDPQQLKDLKKFHLFRSDLLSEQTMRSGDRKQSQLLFYNQIAERLCQESIQYDQFS